MQNKKYSGKKFSILGDSISTLEGYNPEGYSVFYKGDNCLKSGVTQAGDTWWDKVIKSFGGELLVNNSWSGSRVTKLKGQEQLFPSGCSDERTSSLHIDDVIPDVIIVYLGTNDWAFGAKLGADTRILGEEELWAEEEFEVFDSAYSTMLTKLRENYPTSEIWCCTLCTTYMSSDSNFKFPYTYAGNHVAEYNQIIRFAASRHQCFVADLYGANQPYDTIDGTHPNQEGMSTIASMVIREMEMGERVQLNREVTLILYPDTLKLFLVNSDKTITIAKEQVKVGSGNECELYLGCENTKIAPHQATFSYDQGIWYLEDNDSPNGTCINGIKLETGKKYQLAADDEIVFANETKVIFFKTKEIHKSKYVEKYVLPPLHLGQATPPIGLVVENKYRLDRLLFKENSWVYLASNQYSGQKVIVKVVKKEQFISCITSYELQKTITHPHIPIVHEIIEMSDFVYVVMDYFEGETLYDIIHKSDGMNLEDAIKYSIKIAEILQYLHSFPLPIVYGDMKPSNVIITPTGDVKLIDFGSATRCGDPVFEDDIFEDKLMRGTRGYAPLEQMRGMAIPQSDIYAFGMTMYHLVKTVSPQSFQFEYKPIRKVNAKLPKELESIIDKCVKEDYHERYKNCSELLEALRHLDIKLSKNVFRKIFKKY